MVNDSLYRLSRAGEAPVCKAAGPRVRSAAVAALRRRVAALRPDLEIAPPGYVFRMENNLLPGVEPQQFVEDLANGAGHELDRKFLAIHSSAALAVNTFARFKHESGSLPLAGVVGFRSVAFEAQCPIGLRGGRPANLDLVALGPAGVVAVESKCTEHLQPTASRFSPAYAEQIRDERRNGTWFRAMELIRKEPGMFGLLDAAQLIKHAFGLARCFAGRPVSLLYLYWEPTDADRHPILRLHGLELERFSRLIAGGFPTFQAHSYRKLWASWQRHTTPNWLSDHVSNLRARYDVPLG